MVKKFIDLNVQAQKEDSRKAMQERAHSLGVEIYFSNGLNLNDGRYIRFSGKTDFNGVDKPALFHILEPSTKEAQSLLTRASGCIVKTSLNLTLAKKLMQKENLIEIRLSEIIYSSGLMRVRALKEINNNFKYARKAGLGVVITSGAVSAFGLRTGYQIFDLLKVLGFREDEADDAMYNNPKAVLEKGRMRLEGRLVSKGVKII